MYRSLIILFSLLHFSVFAADFEVEGLYPANDSEISRWETKYFEIIKSNIGDLSEYRGSECKLSIFLNDLGDIKSVRILSDVDNNGKRRLLCNEAYSRIVRINKLPLPDDYNVRRQLKNIYIVIDPN